MKPISLKRLEGEYIVICSNNADFLKVGHKIVFTSAAPLGPMGRKSRRSMMYAHNRRIAARRAKESQH